MDKVVSVVIPTLNSEATIVECLDSIYSNKNPPPFEVIVVDGGSTDSTVQFVKKYPVKIILEEKSKASQRNNGVAQSVGNIIAFTDSDTRVANDWLLTLAKHFDDPSIAGVGGPNITPNEDPFWAQCFGVLMESFLGSTGVRNTVIYESICEVKHNPPVNSAVRKSVFKEAGGFARGFEWSQDVMLDAKIKRLGGKLIYDPEMLVWHHRRRTLRGFAKQLLYYGRGRASAFLRYPESLPLTYLCVVAFAIGTVVSIPAYILIEVSRPVIAYGWVAYFLFLVLSSIYIGVQKRSFVFAAVLPPLAFIEHFLLGLGFIIGLIKPFKESNTGIR